MLILASGSPRRQELLSRAGFSFVARATGVVEKRRRGESPDHYVRRLAKEKAEAIVAGPEDIVLGADTVVVAAGRLLEKPADAAGAARMLRLLSGRWHEVLTGICLTGAAATVVDVSSTRVHFQPLTPADIRDYVASGEPLDKAGAYAIQGLASRFVDVIEGCYFNVVGLPVALVWRHWRALTAQRGRAG